MLRSKLGSSINCFREAVFLVAELTKTMLGHAYPAEAVAKGQAILDDTSVSIGEVKDNFLGFLNDEMGVGFTQILHTDCIFGHPKNRSDTMLIAYDAERKGSKAKHSGSDLAQLIGV